MLDELGSRKDQAVRRAIEATGAPLLVMAPSGLAPYAIDPILVEPTLPLRGADALRSRIGQLADASPPGQ